MHLGEDWLYRGIDWSLKTRGTSQLLIRASSKSPYVPLEKICAAVTALPWGILSEPRVVLVESESNGC